MNQHPGNQKRLIALILPLFALLGAAGLVLHASYYAWWCFDDAYITMRCAENFARHGVLEYNVGERVEGFSNLLWTLQLALADRFGAPMMPAARLLALAANVGIVLLGLLYIIYIARRMQSGGVGLAAAMGLLTLALVCSTPLAVHAQSGLETNQYAFFLNLAVIAAMVGAAEGRRTLTLAGAAALALAFLSRPEGFGYYPFFAAAMLIQVPPRQWLALTKKHWLALLLPLLVLAGLLAWRLAYYGAPFPLTVIAKNSLRGFGLRALADVQLFFTYGGPWWAWLLLAMAGGAMFLPRLGAPTPVRTHLAGLILLILANFLFVIRVGGDILNTSRFFVPSILPLALLTVAAFLWLARPRPHSGELARELRLAALAALALLSFRISLGQGENFFHGVEFFSRSVNAFKKVQFWPVATRYLTSGQTLTASSYANGYSGLMVPLIQEHWMPGQSVIIGDIGLPGMLAPDVRIIDASGLVTYEYAWLAHDNGDAQRRPKRVADLLAYLDRVRPEWVMLISHGGRMDLFPGLNANEWKGWRDYHPMLIFWDWGEKYTSEHTIRRVDVLHRADLPLPDPAAISRNYQRLARLFPNAPDVQAICAARRANAAVEMPHRVLAWDPADPARNRIQIKGKTLAGMRFLGRFDAPADEGWTFTGDAMAGQPVLTPVDLTPVQGFVGAGLLNSSHGQVKDTADHGEAASPVFTPQAGDTLAFLLAGGAQPECAVILEVDGQERHRWIGAGSPLLRSVLVDLTPFAGRNARVKVVDRTSDPMGFVLADHFLLLRPAP